MFMPSNREGTLLKNSAVHIASAYLLKGKKKKSCTSEENIFALNHYLTVVRSVIFVIFKLDIFLTGIVSTNSSSWGINMP